MVTSRAVVGSSAISNAGLQESAMAIITRWRMPPAGAGSAPAPLWAGMRNAEHAQRLPARCGDPCP